MHSTIENILVDFENRTEIRRIHINDHKLIIIWLEIPIDSIITDIFSESKIFDDRDECIDYITTNNYDNDDCIIKRVLLVTSKEVASIIPLIYELQEISSIYILDDATKVESDQIQDNNHIQPRTFTAKQKIHGEYHDQNFLCKQIANDIFQYEQYHLPLTICSSSIYKEASIHSLDHESATFMWSHLLIHALTKMHSSKAKIDMLEECRQCYGNNLAELRKIDEFERHYVPSMALWWYTRDSFVYRLLNKAFRLKNIDQIYKFRYIIADLVEQLRTLQKETCQIANSPTILSVYRGQYIAREEIDFLKNNVGGLITLNTFSSTSIDLQMAQNFILDPFDSAGNYAVLFEIIIDTELSITSPYAKISTVSAMPDECEVLLSVGMILRIDSVEKQEFNEHGYWLVKLIVEKEDMLQIKQLFDLLKNDIDKEKSDLIIFSNILWHMGDYDRAEKYLKMLLNELETNDSSEANAYNMLGLIYAAKSFYNEAIEAFNKSITIRHQTHSGYDCIDFAPVYNNLGYVYSLKENYKEALNFYQQAFDLAQKYLPENDLQLFTYTMNIAMAYDNLTDYVKSLTFYKKAFVIIVKHIQFDHPAISTLYSNIASVYRKLGEYEQSMKYQQIAHTIWTKTLPPFHSNLVQSHDNLGTAYASLSNYDEALKHFHLALEIIENHHSHAHKNMLAASCHNNIGTTYLAREQFESALIHFEKALDVYKQYKKNSSIATIYDNIGTLYLNLGDYPKAMENYSISIKFQMLQLPIIDKSALAQTIDNIGLIQFHFGMYNEALRNFQSAFEFVDGLLPSDHPSVLMYQNHVEMTNNHISQ